ncbi:ATP-binding protein, partial [Candidatus Puniceispirillum sp.]|uniref:ATP-binding protein n=1 Tax=Candidatus Puniceispirillum sp. TaxID=2026719 RepID=UPI001ED6BEB0|nr:two-component sensor histidine kinase [Candidatus Puniceispirillum sp.]
AFINIIKNASEATDKNGELIIKTSYAPGRRLSITSIAEQLHVPIQVEVIDNGRGIPEDIRDHLFDPFVSGRVGGSGLGLAMVASVIADHGGLMEVETVTGETVFRLNFPATTAQQTKRAPKNEETDL